MLSGAVGAQGRKPACELDQVLVVESHPADRSAALAQALVSHGCAVSVADIEAAATQGFLFAVLPSGPDGAPALDRLRRLREHAPSLRVAVVGGAGNVAAAVEAMRAQAFEYLEEPVGSGALEALIRRARACPDPRQAALLESLQILMPGLVHELRNPLSGVLTGSQMLTRLLQGRGATCDYAGIIQEEAQKLGRFLARLAEFGRLRSGGLQFVDALDLSALLRRLLDAATPACKARRIRIVASLDPQASLLRGDPGRLSQACAELLQNAQDAMPEGGTLSLATRRVAEIGETTARRQPGPPGSQEGWISVECHDTGPGLTAEAIQRGCEPFFSTRPGALGVGLSLAQAIVCAHGGAIRLGDCSAPGGRATLFLPVRSPGQPQASWRPEPEQAARGSRP